MYTFQGSIIGPKVFAPLKKLYPDIAIQGVKYPADIPGNLTPAGADAGGIKEAQRLFTEATTKCANAMLVGGGYSQGAALMHRAIEALPKNVQDRIVAVVLYGDTKNKQDGGRIKNFPPEKVKIFCNKNDGVCSGALNVNAGHLSYGDSFQPGAQFIAEKLKAGKGSGGAAPASGGDSSEGGEAPAAPAPKAAKGGKGKGKGGGGGEGHGIEEMI
jgi:cutinase